MTSPVFWTTSFRQPHFNAPIGAVPGIQHVPLSGKLKDHFSYLIDQQHRFLLIGIIILVMAAVFTLSGETSERYHGVVYRAEEPKRFWWDVVLYFLAGLFFIGVHLYLNSN